MIELDTEVCQKCGHLCHCVEADHDGCNCKKCECISSDKLDEEAFNGA